MFFLLNCADNILCQFSLIFDGTELLYYYHFANADFNLFFVFFYIFLIIDRASKLFSVEIWPKLLIFFLACILSTARDDFYFIDVVVLVVVVIPIAVSIIAASSFFHWCLFVCNFFSGVFFCSEWIHSEYLRFLFNTTSS